MHPVLITIGPVSIYTYGLFVALGFLTGILLAQKEAARLGQAPSQIGDLCFFLLIAAIVGSRLFYIAVNPGDFLQNPLEIFKIWNGGLVFYGGFIGAAVTAAVYLKKKQLPLWQTVDILAPGVAAGHVFGRMGCFAAGCCYGKACDFPWAVTFTHPMSLAPHGIPLHPTQLYEVINNLLLFAFLWWFRKRKRFDGQVFWVYLLLYGVTRSLLEIFRGDPRGLFWGGLLSISQIIGLSLAAISVAMLIYKPGRRPLRKASRKA